MQRKMTSSCSFASNALALFRTSLSAYSCSSFLTFLKFGILRWLFLKWQSYAVNTWRSFSGPSYLWNSVLNLWSFFKLFSQLKRSKPLTSFFLKSWLPIAYSAASLYKECSRSFRVKLPVSWHWHVHIQLPMCLFKSWMCFLFPVNLSGFLLIYSCLLRARCNKTTI